MGDYGIRISYDGYDVKTCNDIDCVLTSKYPVLKGSISGSGSTTVSSGTPKTITIAHGLSYIPNVQGFAYDNSGYIISLYFQLPVYFFDGDVEIGWSVSADTTNVYLYFSYTDYFTGVGSRSVAYKYFIYLDKGKL